VHCFDSAIVAKGLSGMFNLPVRVSLEATGVYSLDPAVALDRVDGIEVAELNPKIAIVCPSYSSVKGRCGRRRSIGGIRSADAFHTIS
jgi:hypothetical protein